MAPADVLAEDAIRVPPILVGRSSIWLRVAEDDWDMARAFLKQKATPQTLAGLGRLLAARRIGQIEVIGDWVYRDVREVAGKRVKELRLVPAVATALSLPLGNGIVSDDGRLGGCGVPIWSLRTVETELAVPAEEPHWYVAIRPAPPPSWPYRVRFVPRRR